MALKKGFTLFKEQYQIFPEQISQDSDFKKGIHIIQRSIPNLSRTNKQDNDFEKGIHISQQMQPSKALIVSTANISPKIAVLLIYTFVIEFKIKKGT